MIIIYQFQILDYPLILEIEKDARRQECLESIENALTKIFKSLFKIVQYLNPLFIFKVIKDYIKLGIGKILNILHILLLSISFLNFASSEFILSLLKFCRYLERIFPDILMRFSISFEIFPNAPLKGRSKSSQILQANSLVYPTAVEIDWSMPIPLIILDKKFYDNGHSRQ